MINKIPVLRTIRQINTDLVETSQQLGEVLKNGGGEKLRAKMQERKQRPLQTAQGNGRN